MTFPSVQLNPMTVRNDGQHLQTAIASLLSQNTSLRHLEMNSHASTACFAALSGLALLTKLVFWGFFYFDCMQNVIPFFGTLSSNGWLLASFSTLRQLVTNFSVSDRVPHSLNKMFGGRYDSNG